MPLALCPIGPNHNEVKTATRTLVFSYETLVAVRVYGVGTKIGGEYKTNQFHSKTTSKHINKSGFKDAQAVSPDELAKLAEG
jgi:hypothetical protein